LRPEALQDHRRRFLGEGLDQLVPRALRQLADGLCDRGVVDRLVHRVAARRHAGIDRHPDIHHQRLGGGALPFVDADDRLDVEALDEDAVHADTRCGGKEDFTCFHPAAYAAGRVSMSQRGVTRTSGPSCWPACSRSAPANAIIAPLSVQNAGRGNATRPPRRRAISPSFARKRSLAPTPPATTSVSHPASSSARSHLIVRVSTTASSKPRAMSARAWSDWSLSCQAVSTWVLRPLKLKSSPGRLVMGRGNR